VLGEKTVILASFQTVVSRDKFFPKKLRVYPLPPRGFIPLLDLKNQVREKYYQEGGEINRFSNVRYKIISQEKGMFFIFSMTDRARITFERGDFTLFILLLRPLIAETRRMLDILRRNSYSTLTESTQEGKRIEIASFDLIEALVFKKSKHARDWFGGTYGEWRYVSRSFPFFDVTTYMRLLTYVVNANFFQSFLI
jgi:hypothetical protein